MAASAVVFAYHEVGVRCLGVLLDRGVDVRLVLTHRDDPGEHVWFASAERVARERGIAVETNEDFDALAPRIAAATPDFIFSFYYRRMLPAALLQLALRGAYNMHGSLLPRYRGRAPVNWAILKGERETGATLHEMVAKPDAGRIVDQQAVAIGENDLAGEVMERVAEAAAMVLERALPALIDGTARAREQDLARGSYFGGRRPEDGRIDWTRPAREVHDLVRAVAPPYPGAFTTWNGAPARILRTWWGEVPATLAAAAPGAVAATGARAFVAAGDGRWLEVLEAEVAGEMLAGARLASFFATRAARMGQSAP